MTQGKLAQLYRKALGYSRRDFCAYDGTAHVLEVADSGSGGVIADLLALLAILLASGAQVSADNVLLQ